MKSVVAIVTVFSFFIVSAYGVYALESTRSGKATKDYIQSKRLELKERIASRTASLKERLSTFKDKNKAERAERVNDNLNKINEKRTKQMLKHVDVMKKLLERLENWVNEQGAKGKDTAEAKAAINKAKGSIDKAKQAVEEQADKDYTLDATGEDKIREAAKEKRDMLHDDLQAVRKLLIDAKQAVSEAIKVAAKTLGGLRGNGK